MKKSTITLFTAVLAVVATPASAANISTPTPNQTITSEVGAPGPATISIENADLRGKRYDGHRHKRIAKFKHKSFHGKKFHGHHKGFKVKHRVHHKHGSHFEHDRKFHHHKFKGRHLKHKTAKHFKY